MRAAVITNGVVANIIVVDALTDLPDLQLIDIEDIQCNIGDAWDGTKVIPAPALPPIPTIFMMTEAEKQSLLLAQSEMIALLFEKMTGGVTP